MRYLSDPVTVNREKGFMISIAYPNHARRRSRTMICEPGNLLDVREELPSKAEHSKAMHIVQVCRGETDYLI